MVLEQSLGQIGSNVVKKNKETGIISIHIFYVLHGKYLLKQKVVVPKILEWKFKASIARNPIFEGHIGPSFCPIWVKDGKKLIVFKNFNLVSQSYSHKIDDNIISVLPD